MTEELASTWPAGLSLPLSNLLPPLIYRFVYLQMNGDTAIKLMFLRVPIFPHAHQCPTPGMTVAEM